MGKGNTETQTTDQQRSGQTEFANQSFLEQLRSQFQQSQEQQQSQSQSQFENQQTSNTQNVRNQAYNEAVQSGMSEEQAREFANQQASNFEQTQTSTTGLSGRDIAFQDLIRGSAAGAAGGITADMFAPGTQDILDLTASLRDPFAQEQISALEDQAARSQALSRTNTQQEATAAGAFGGSRHGIAEAVRAGEIDRALAGQTASILSDAQRTALNAAIPLAGQQAMAPAQAAAFQQQLLTGALGPTGTTTTGTAAGTSGTSQTGTSAGTTTGTQTGTTTGTQTGTDTSQNVTGQRGTSQQDTQSFINSLSQLFGLDQSRGAESGTQTVDERIQGTTTNQTQQGLLSSLMGLGGIFLGSPAGASILGQLFGQEGGA